MSEKKLLGLADKIGGNIVARSEVAVSTKGGAKEVERFCTITVADLFMSLSLTSQLGLKSGHLSPVKESGAVRINVNMSMREK